MGTRRKKRPEFELPAILIETISNYLGPTLTNGLTSDQAQALMTEASACAAKVGQIINLEEEPEVTCAGFTDAQPAQSAEPNGGEPPSGAEDVQTRPA